MTHVIAQPVQPQLASSPDAPQEHAPQERAPPQDASPRHASPRHVPPRHVPAPAASCRPASGPCAPTLETARLLLVPPGPQDLDDAAAMWAHPAVYGMIGGRPFTREEVWQRLLRYIGHWHLLGYGTWTLRSRDGGAYLGSVGLMDSRRQTVPPIDGAVEAGWTLAPHAQGRGYAREALAAMFAWADAAGIGPAVCIIDPTNAPSIRLAERLGFGSAGTIRYRDAPIMLFRREKSRPSDANGAIADS